MYEQPVYNEDEMEFAEDDDEAPTPTAKQPAVKLGLSLMEEAPDLDKEEFEEG